MSFPLAAYGVNPDDVRYFHVNSVVRGKGRDRLKYLDMEGRWVLSGRSIPYISATFNHLEKLNYAQGPLFDITQPALDAIGMVGWTPEKQPKKKKPFVIEPPPVVEVVEEPQSPREAMPHRSAGYGLAHQKRKLSIPDRSRSPSITSRGASPTPEFDRYAAKYHRKVSKRQCPDLQKSITLFIELDGSIDETDSGLPSSNFSSPGIPSGQLTPHQMFQKEIVEFDRSKLKHHEKNPKGNSENSFEKFKREIEEFNRSKLRQVKTQKSNYVSSLSPKEILNTEIRNFNRNKLKHTDTKISSSPVFDKKNKYVPEDLYVLIPLSNYKEEGCQTDPIEVVEVPPEPDSGIGLEEEFEWALVEEKVSLIRIEETEYYLEEDSITYYGTKWNGSRDDQGYSSGAPSPNASGQEPFERMPHRTQAISPLPEFRGRYDSEYDPSYLKRANESGRYENDVTEIKARADRAKHNPRAGSYGARYHSDYSSGSEQPSPNKRVQTAEEYLLESYHKMTPRGSRYQPA